jgi:hypothetical protein
MEIWLIMTSLVDIVLIIGDLTEIYLNQPL